ncbi:MAG TPA: hypothetical protein O0X18_09255, partial [Methanocorpusculum sp.]|nr:hypothetical protein [Methanocorpusculum sp.]
KWEIQKKVSRKNNAIHKPECHAKGGGLIFVIFSATPQLYISCNPILKGFNTGGHPAVMS